MLNTLIDFLFPKDAAAQALDLALEHSPGDAFFSTLPASELFSADENGRDEQGGRSGRNVHSLFAYSDERVKHLVWEIKYHRNTRVAAEVGRLMAEKIRSVCFAEAETFIVIPVPLTRKRLNERGFHHTELVAKAVMAHLAPTAHSSGQSQRIRVTFVPDALLKTKHTAKQSSLEHRSERLTNVVGAFCVKDSVIEKNLIHKNNIIVIDDVVTTGATMADVERALREAGANSVFCFAIAH